MDKITIKGLNLFAYHGVNPEEKENGQNFILDIDYYLESSVSCLTDDVDDTVSYAKVVKCVRKAFLSDKYNLIEKAAQVVAEAIINEFDLVKRVDITLKKPQAPVSADFDYMAVTISRIRLSMGRIGKGR